MLTYGTLARSCPVPPVALLVGWPTSHRGHRARRGCRRRSFPPSCLPTTPLLGRNSLGARKVQRPLRLQPPRRLPTTSARPCSREQHPRSRALFPVVVAHQLFEQARWLRPADRRGVGRRYRRFDRLSLPALPHLRHVVQHHRPPRHQSRLSLRRVFHLIH